MTSDPAATEPEDPYLWLEEIDSPAALDWVSARNAETAATLESRPGFAALRAQIREVLDSEDRIPAVSLIGDHLYNFWRDAGHERGIWRRTTFESYETPAPAWETVLDLDALGAREETSWVWHGASILRPAPGEPWRRALVDMSRGGSDADETREFDLVDLRFVDASDNGFHRPEAKGGLAWIDDDTVYAFTDTGPGSLTTSGYPRTVRRWRRGTDLEDAPVVYEGDVDDLYISAWRSHTPGFERDFVHRSRTFYTSELYLVTDAGTPHEAHERIDVPDSAMVGTHREWLLIELRDPWRPADREYAAGTLLAIRFDAFRSGMRDFTVLFAPTPTQSLASATWTRHHLALTVLDDVRSVAYSLTPPATPGACPGESRTADAGGWRRTELPGLPEIGSVGLSAVDAIDRDDLWVTTTDYLTPSTLSLVNLDAPVSRPIKAAPAFFSAEGLTVEQRFATSRDGTRVPYFVVGPRGAADAPTLLYGYGGFEVSLTPGYSGSLGRAWLARGGVYVVANIRGGGEYGPSWHQAALREHRHRAYEDFAAVARDLVAGKITTPGRLACEGASNGGLLAGNMLVGYPELFGAVVVGVPLLDMRRYTHLLAGASWSAEYGDPDDPEQWAFLRTFSPYQLFDPSRSYPPVLFTTSTRDDRVHPGHARKMAAKMLAAGKDVTYYENVEGGHGAAADNAQAAHMAALRYEFCWARLKAE